jgi:hypothetical protein
MDFEVSMSELTDIIDREKIRDRLVRLSRGVDRRDAELIRACYWPEASDDEGVAVCSVDELVDWIVPGDPAIALTLHTLGQSLIELDGDTALAETHVTAYHRVRVDDHDRDIVLAGRYLDRLERRAADWRVSHRKLLCDWQNDLGAAADWSQGLFGAPFVSEHTVGLARGDDSESFFRSEHHPADSG